MCRSKNSCLVQQTAHMPFALEIKMVGHDLASHSLKPPGPAISPAWLSALRAEQINQTKSSVNDDRSFLRLPLTIEGRLPRFHSLATMISRATLARQGQRALQCRAKRCSSRCFASAASGSFNYETGDAAGVKVASRDLPGPTTHLAVVAKAGTRYQPLPGFSEGLEKFAFKVCCSSQ